MTDNTATAYRRAAVLVKHHLAGNLDGINAILQEVIEPGPGSVGPLIGALLTSLDEITSQLVTAAGKDAFIEMIGDLADYTADTPTVRGARFLTAYYDRDPDRMNAVMLEGDDDNISPTIIGVMQVYTHIVPTLTSNVALDMLDNGIRAFMNLEEGGEIA